MIWGCWLGIEKVDGGWRPRPRSVGRQAGGRFARSAFIGPAARGRQTRRTGWQAMPGNEHPSGLPGRGHALAWDRIAPWIDL